MEDIPELILTDEQRRLQDRLWAHACEVGDERDSLAAEVQSSLNKLRHKICVN